MNFLVQAAALAASISPLSVGEELSRSYNKTLREVSQKLVIRMYAWLFVTDADDSATHV